AGDLAGLLVKHIANENFVDPFALCVFGFSPSDQLKCAERYVRNRISAAPRPLAHVSTVPGAKVRIAYFSSDFRQHPVGLSIVELIERHDKARFETIGVSHGHDDAGE